MKKIRLIYRALRFRYKYDIDEIAFLLKTIKKGDTVIDIGGYKGVYTYWMAGAVGRQGRVHTFEPQPELANYLIDMKDMMKWDWVTINNMGLSSTKGTATLNVPGIKPSPRATLEPNLIKDDIVIHTVKIDTLDNYYFGIGDKISFIKCDVEGHELDVFKGGEGILKRDKPILMFECEGAHRANGSIDEVFSYLEGFLGYRGSFFLNGTLHDIKEFVPDKYQKNADSTLYINNFIFK
jgi:FkbM family methyltransferase